LAYATLLEEDRSPRKRGDGTGIAGASTIRLLAMTPDEENGLAETLWVEVDGLRIRCLAAGSGGPPVLLLHGGGLDSPDFTYKYIIGPLAEERWVSAPGWPGYGLSDKPDVDYTVPFYVGLSGAAG
jgi:hypothetical protein